MIYHTIISYKINNVMKKIFFARPRQTLIQHLQNVVNKSAEFAKDFFSNPLAEIAGCWHDIGKYSEKFQQRLNDEALRVDHSTAGARHAQTTFCEKKNGDYYIGRLLAYAIAGHHSGLPDGISEETACLENRLVKKIEPIQDCPADILKRPDLTSDSLRRFLCNRRDKTHCAFGLSFLIRMIFSCLVDSDRLDAEAFDDKNKSETRKAYPALSQCAAHFFQKLNAFVETAEPTEVNRVRKSVLEQCLAAAEREPGLFSLTVPTGGGKTLSSLAFALKHALHNGNNLSRVIYVIPYTSIIEQNAQVFKKYLPEHAVIEHHCNFVSKEKSEDETSIFETLATDNWDAPVIVTTSVQFFESLFSNSPSQCRKLHNIARSVVILDEAQNLPRDLLLPVIEAIRELSGRYGTSVVLCTATQPAITVNDEFKDGLENVREIIRDPVALAAKLKRTEILSTGDKTLEVEEVAQMVLERERVLCIVNTRTRARDLFKACNRSENIFHLSAAMCPVHRNKKLDQIRTILSATDGSPCRVVSTQLVEAGVDLDFPCVLREIAGLDSIHQAAGRCNREGRLTKGEVLVFEFTDGPPKLFRRQAQLTRAIEREFNGNIMELATIREYFKKLFWTEGREALDKHKILEQIGEGSESANFPFKKISEEFRLIPDKTRPVVIQYDNDAKEIIRQLKAGVMSKTIFRKAQQYSVSIYEKDFNRLADAGSIKPVTENMYYLDNMDLYDDDLGLDIDDPYYRSPDSNII